KEHAPDAERVLPDHEDDELQDRSDLERRAHDPRVEGVGLDEVDQDDERDEEEEKPDTALVETDEADRHARDEDCGDRDEAADEDDEGEEEHGLAAEEPKPSRREDRVHESDDRLRLEHAAEHLSESSDTRGGLAIEI